METLTIPKEELKALQSIMKRNKQGMREALRHLLIEDGALHATDGKVLLRIDPEVVPAGGLVSGVWEVLKVDKTRPRLPSEVTLSRLEALQAPSLKVLLSQKTNKSAPAPFELPIDAEAITRSKAIITLFDRFRKAYSYELLGTLAPLDRSFEASLVDDRGMLRLENCKATALVMAFDLK